MTALPPTNPALRVVEPVGQERTPRLRARRIPVDVEKLGEVRATLRHPELGMISGVVQDLSLLGIGLALEGDAQSSLLMSGDRLEDLEVICRDTVLYRGNATLRRVGDETERLVLGIELEGGGIDLARLHHLESRQSFSQRWHRLDVGVRHDRVTADFKAWVSDLRSFLELTREFLDGEEKALAGEDQLTREETLQQYLDEMTPRFLAAMFGARDRLNEIVEGLSEEDHQTYRSYFRLHLLPLLHTSPLLRRSFEKPLGYAGDYEMMNMLYRSHAEGSSLFGKAVNIYAASEGAARANINRIDYLGNKVRSALATSERHRVRIASVGCGPAREIQALLDKSPELGERLDVALIDQEERSITFCERTLTPLARSTGARIQFIRESVRRLLTSRRLAEALGERELIYSAGLFDYLAERSFEALLRVLYGALSPGGTLAVGNVALKNPSRWMMEYYCDWFLNHRTSGDLLAQASALAPTPTSVEVEAEPTGVNLFLLVRR